MKANGQGWVHEQSLKAFLECIALFLRHNFDDDDWAAIQHGLKDTNTEKGRWFDYEFGGDQKAVLKLGRDDPGTGVVMIDVDVPPALVPKVETALEIVSHFKFIT